MVCISLTLVTLSFLPHPSFKRLQWPGFHLWPQTGLGVPVYLSLTWKIFASRPDTHTFHTPLASELKPSINNCVIRLRVTVSARGEKHQNQLFHMHMKFIMRWIQDLCCGFSCNITSCTGTRPEPAVPCLKCKQIGRWWEDLSGVFFSSVTMSRQIFSDFAPGFTY